VRQIDVADQAVGEGEPQLVVAKDFHVADVMERRPEAYLYMK
jgi:hypothetical protein